jgi:hypothetical protein
MNTKVALGVDFLQLLTLLISESNDGDPPFNSIGKRLKCSQPVLGQWIDECNFPFLMETLALSDQIFSCEFPTIPLSLKDRQAFAKVLQAHSQECAHCNAKKTEDIEWKERVGKAINKNKQMVGAWLIDAVDKD